MSRVEQGVVTSDKKPKNPGRVKAMKTRWYSEEWREWRESFLQTLKQQEFTQEHRDKISAAKKGQKTALQTMEVRRSISKKKGGIMGQAFPLFQRGWYVSDVIELGFERRQVTNALAKMKIAGLVKRPTQEEKKEGAVRSHRTKEYLPEENNSHLLARRFLDDGLVVDNLEYFNKLQNLYQERGRKLPESSSDRLRLEVFLRAVSETKEGDGSLIRKYIERGQGVDPVWFAKNLVVDEEAIAFSAISAEEILSYYQAKPVGQLLKEQGIEMPDSFRERGFLEMFYAVRLTMCAKAQKGLQDGASRIEMRDFQNLWEKIDPDIFERLNREISVIREKTKAIVNPSKGGSDFDIRLERSGTIFELDGPAGDPSRQIRQIGNQRELPF